MAAPLVFDPQIAKIQFSRESHRIGEHLGDIPYFEDKLDVGIHTEILETAGKIAKEHFHPWNHIGDRDGCTFNKGAVTTAPGNKEAYEVMKNTQPITQLSGDENYGGFGFPLCMTVGATEIYSTANTGGTMKGGLAMGAGYTLSRHATPEIKEVYLPPLISMDVGGTMDLTEPEAGTALSKISTRATPAEDPAFDPENWEEFDFDGYEGMWDLNGGKIWISSGKDDLTENVFHIVLAKAPNAKPGTARGVSVFLVPEFMQGEDGEWNVPNGVKIEGIEEHKMGIKANPSCAVRFENAKGYLLGELGDALTIMGDFMKEARIFVGYVQAVGQMELSLQQAVKYGWDRLQPGPIGEYEGVYQRFVEMEATADAGRMFGVWVAMHLDIENHSEDPEQRARSAAITELFTPILKAWNTNNAERMTSLGLQTFGGSGYTTQPYHQIVRDTRIQTIYEGENHAAQARYMVGQISKSVTARVMALGESVEKPEGISDAEHGAALLDMALDMNLKPNPANGDLPPLIYEPFFEELSQEIEKARRYATVLNGKNAERMTNHADQLEEAGMVLIKTINAAVKKGAGDESEALAAANNLLELFGRVTGGMMHMKLAINAQAHLDAGNNPDGMKAQLYYSDHYMTQIMDIEGLKSLGSRVEANIAFHKPGQEPFLRAGKEHIPTPSYAGPKIPVLAA